MADNNIPNPDPFLLQQLIEKSTREGTNRRRQEGQQHAPPGQRRPRRIVRHEEEEEHINIPEGADPTTALLLKELRKTNNLLRLQDDRIHELERKRRYRSPPRRRYRSRSYSSSRSPPRRHRRRSPSSSRSPPRRYRRRRSYSRSPPRKSRKNQRPGATETGSLSPERDHRGPSKAVLKPRERSPPRDSRQVQTNSRESPGEADTQPPRDQVTRRTSAALCPKASEEPASHGGWRNHQFWTNTTGQLTLTTIFGASKASWITTSSGDPSNAASFRPPSGKER
ncbi:uncharacterized protein LOC131624875 [Vicia villosa]|uniref:uncharacterized protein LOC131624875 n=1 Tax=Vicia villosa TaxID=3911 RepID=UPI00273AD9D6|nr:uncharacterized protein LOC131624875 [Vicia villosa]